MFCVACLSPKSCSSSGNSSHASSSNGTVKPVLKPGVCSRRRSSVVRPCGACKRGAGLLCQGPFSFMVSPVAYLMRLARCNCHAYVEVPPCVRDPLVPVLLAWLDKSGIRRAYCLHHSVMSTHQYS